ncbi:hypothetical protein [Anaeromicropila herbilytica]|uniref:Uncharacterized protein n=1 Tax=Anaeromicropila herbilytica TaxID=2785025 RepID=A0A7R7EJS6_9FIRM|nr:hypothetical protein [Anaeromicropila herbilytica]BCN30029.1 hypothetical protein bsdtb5_13240 [Anaeromicropila herbilytica]
MQRKKIYLVAFLVVLIICSVLLYNNLIEPNTKEVFDGTLVRQVNYECHI